MAEGPIGCAPGMRDSLIELADVVFRRGMGPAFPHLFHEDNLGNCRITVEDGKVVSHIGYTLSDASILGAPLRVACLGAVGTYEKYRGRGYASAEFTDCLRRMESQGVHLLMVSGGRNMYRRNHCVRVGLDFGCEIDSEAAAALARADVSVRHADADRIDEVIGLQRLEPVRFVRRRDFWLMAAGWLANSWRKGEIIALERGAGAEAYLIMSKARKEGWAQVLEYGGDRGVLAGGLAGVLDHLGARAVGLHVAGWDGEMLRALGSGGVELKEDAASGTQRIVHFAGLMGRLRPLFAERIGSRDAAGLEFDESGEADSESFSVRLAGSELAIPDRDVLGRLVFGTHEGEERALLRGSKAADAMAECLPVPALNYGISYV